MTFRGMRSARGSAPRFNGACFPHGTSSHKSFFSRAPQPQRHTWSRKSGAALAEYENVRAGGPRVDRKNTNVCSYISLPSMARNRTV